MTVTDDTPVGTKVRWYDHTYTILTNAFVDQERTAHGSMRLVQNTRNPAGTLLIAQNDLTIYEKKAKHAKR